MPARTFLKRIERAEEVLKAHSIFSTDCICFPEEERPFFGFPIEMEIAGAVKCPLHGRRFTPLIHIYVAKWLREKLWERLATFHSEQYRKAWFATFPPELWPAEEEEDESGMIFLRLKDGTRLLAFEPCWTRRTSSATKESLNGTRTLQLSGMGAHE
jgi:hypothetical protein